MTHTIPPCKSPHHPKGISRTASMVVISEEDERVIFGCRACKEVEKILSVQVRTLPRGWQRARETNKLKGVERAENVQRNQRGRILYFT